MRKYRSIVFVWLTLSIVSYANAADTSKYGSLKEFCIAEEKDTPKNCECGQATADKILSSKEQTLALALMQGDSKALSQLGEKHDAFMNKLSKVTRGCPDISNK